MSELETLVKQLVGEIRALIKERTEGSLPAVLTKKRAAQELGVSLSKLKGLIRRGEVAVCEVGSTSMVPSSEVLRIAGSAKRKAAAAPSRPKLARAAKGVSPTEEARTVRQSLKSPPRRSR